MIYCQILITPQQFFPSTIQHPHLVFEQFVCAFDLPALTTCLSLSVHKPVPKALGVIFFCGMCKRVENLHALSSAIHFHAILDLLSPERNLHTLCFKILVWRTRFILHGITSQWLLLIGLFITELRQQSLTAQKNTSQPDWMWLYLYPSANTERHFHPYDLCCFPQTKTTRALKMLLIFLDLDP